jgi:DNA-binding NarL/FixJ family response regulator
MDPPLRVTLVDDDEITTRGLAAMLHACPEPIEMVRLGSPLTKPVDIALFDHALSHTDRRPTLAHLVADSRIRKVVVYTWNFQPWAAGDFISQGASAYLSKGLTSTELIKTLRTVHAEPGPVAAPATPGNTRRRNHAEHGDLLTGREAEMLSLICSGYSNIEVAAALNLSLNSVKSYIRSCYRKIEVDSRSKAVLWGLGHGLGGAQLPTGPPAGTASAGAPGADVRAQRRARVAT